MSFEGDLRTHLMDATITQYVGERITPVIRKEKSDAPAVTFQRIAGVPMTDLDGEDGHQLNIRMQIDVWAKSHDTAKLIAEAIRIRMKTAATTFKSVMLLDQDFYEETPQVFRVSMDFSCWYRTS